jgi:hypothetical protein
MSSVHGASYHSPASVFIGAVTVEYQQQIKDVMGSRLKSSSKVDTVLRKWWRPHRLQHGLPVLIPPGSPSRGGEMASFVLHMANTFQLKYGTMQGYVGAVKELHVQSLGSIGDPLDGVLDWSKFMQALHVQCFVDSSVESHVMVPFNVMVRVLLALDHSDRSHVALGCMILMMYYTMARSATPLPKTKDGFDPTIHIRRKDVRKMGSTQHVEWGLGIVKNSNRLKRAKCDPDDRTWKPVGDCTGVLSMSFWYELYVGMSSWASEGEPFFFDSAGVPFTYSFMLRLFRTRISLLPEFTWDSARVYGFHGLRVLGFNCTRAAAGEDVAVLQGGWSSEAFRTYSREQLARILAVAQVGADYAASRSLPSMPMDATPVPPSALPEDGPLAPVDTPPQTVNVPHASAPDCDSELPVDAVKVVRHAKARSYSVWRWRGKVYESKRRLLAAFASSSEFDASLTQLGYTFVAAPTDGSSSN